MSTNLFLGAKARFFDSNGNPLSGGLLYSYSAGTATPLATYTTRGGGVANANPVVLDANGEADVWLSPGVDYKFVLKTSAGVIQWTEDNVPSVAGDDYLADGSASTPALAFRNDIDCGLYRAGANNPAMAAGGTKVQDWSPTGSSFPLLATVADGAVGAPALAFTADADTGLYRVGANNPAMAVGGVQAQSWAATGSTFPQGIVATQSQAATAGITATGNTSGAGVSGTGGASNAAGLTGTGGATNGNGMTGQGTGTGSGGSFTGGASNGNGAIGTGVGTGNGVKGVASNTSSSSSGVYGVTTSSSVGVLGQSTGTGAAVSALASGSSGDAVVGTNTGSGIAGNFSSTSGTGYAIQANGNATKAALRLVPQAAPSSGSIGDLYVDAAGILYVCTNGAGPIWTKVGTQV